MLENELSIVEAFWEQRDHIIPTRVDPTLQAALDTVFDALESGTVRAASFTSHGEWITHTWIKKAILLAFKSRANASIAGQFAQFYDKIPLQFTQYTDRDFEQRGIRLVPPACVRRGAYIAPRTVLMPSYVNIGAYIGEGTLVDTWATVGSCAQIGQNVHLSGGVGIGGVLEPLQANPTIIEDNCFIGARSEIVEGVIVEKGAVISMGVFIGQSTRIYDRDTQTISYGKIPAGAVVVPGNLPAKDGSHSVYCAIIVKRVDEKTRQKVGLNELLRESLDTREI